MRQFACTIGVLVALPFLACVSLAQEVGSKEWLEQALKTASEAQIPEATYFRIRSESGPQNDQAYLASLEKEINGKPEHPKRMEYEELRRRLTNGPDIGDLQCWFFDAKHWRLSEDTPTHPSARIPWRDAALDGNTAWRLIPDTVTVLDVQSPERGYDPSTSLRVARSKWLGITTGALYHANAWSVVSVEQNGSSWQALIRSSDGDQDQTLLGTIEPDGHLFISERITRKLVSNPDWVGATSKFEPAEETDDIPEMIPGLMPARSINREALNGMRGPSSDVLVAVTLIKPEQASSLLKMPQPGHEDAVRDLSGLSGIIDRTKNQVFEVTSSGPKQGISEQLRNRDGMMIV